MPKARVTVTLKEGILDAQGQTVKTALEHLGFAVDDVRIGKFIELRIPDGVTAEDVKSMSERLLSNPVLENFRFEIEPD